MDEAHWRRGAGDGVAGCGPGTMRPAGVGWRRRRSPGRQTRCPSSVVRRRTDGGRRPALAGLTSACAPASRACRRGCVLHPAPAARAARCRGFTHRLLSRNDQFAPARPLPILASLAAEAAYRSRRAMLKSLGKLAALAALVLAVGAVAAQERTRIKVGVSVGNAEQTFEVVKKVAARDGLDIRSLSSAITCSPTRRSPPATRRQCLPAQALPRQPDQGAGLQDRAGGPDLDGTAGHLPKRYKSVDQLPAGARIGIQNDPSNGNRALLLLQKAGLLAAAGRRRERRQCHAARRGGEPAQAEADRAGCGAIAARPRRSRRGLDQ